MTTPTPPYAPEHWLHCCTETPLGTMRLARSERGLCGAWFVEDQKHAWPADRFTAAKHHPDDPLLQRAAAQLQAWWAGRQLAFDLPLDLSAGTAFQQSVWHALLHIPYGRTCSYLALANMLGKPSATRAVGAAVGRNPLGIIVPCHRVLGSTGRLTGYAGGLWRKQALLEREAPSIS